ncbi:MAG: S46 family peptidase [Gemmatimonadales bacterium]
MKHFGLLLLALPFALAAQQPGTDTIRAGRFDAGKMWTFEYPPDRYFTETYGFTADSGWFARARLAALRLPGCSAAFVSPHGLVVTNHHCARDGVSAVSRPGETLLDSGFVAQTQAEERRVPDLFADQLLAVQDVTDEILPIVDRAGSDTARARVRREASTAVQSRLKSRHGSSGDSVWVQVMALYNGGRYSAYVFRRFTDVRLVAAPELQMGFFGGDPDNFTYPRYALDFAVLRVYGVDGKPYETPHWFPWGKDGVRAGDAVFVIGNPGSTSRLKAMSQLEYERAVSVPAQVAFLATRLDALRAFYAAHPALGDSLDMRNWMFGLSNSLKSSQGRYGALLDLAVMAKRRDAERQLTESLTARRDLKDRYGRLLRRMADVQMRKATFATPHRAFAFFGSAFAGSALSRRALAAAQLAVAGPDSTAVFKRRLGALGNQPRALERSFLALELADVVRAYGPTHPLARAALAGQASPEAAAEALLNATVLADSGRTAVVLAGSGIPADDPALRLAGTLVPAIQAFNRDFGTLLTEERELASELGRARFAVYGRSLPPDGTFSPRSADGVVQGYPYNGTLAPPFTTFYGMYDRFRAAGPGSDWDLPYRWRTPPVGLDLGTPLDFVSTADTYGGNSGSPAVTKELQLAGLNFDRNIDALVRDYIYLPERGRNVMVDVRAIQAALEMVYGARRVVQELLTGQLGEQGAP